MKLRRPYRGGSRTAATSKMERFVIIVNGFKPLTIITKCSILDVAAVLDPPGSGRYRKTITALKILGLKCAHVTGIARIVMAFLARHGYHH